MSDKRKSIIEVKKEYEQKYNALIKDGINNISFEKCNFDPQF